MQIWQFKKTEDLNILKKIAIDHNARKTFSILICSVTQGFEIFYQL